MTDTEQVISRLEEASSKGVANGFLPVLIKVNAGILYLGDASSHKQAMLMGLANDYSCDKCSRATIGNNPQKFYLLH